MTQQQQTTTAPAVGQRVIWQTRRDVAATVTYARRCSNGDWLVGLHYDHQDQVRLKIRPHIDVYWSECEPATGDLQ